MVELDKKKLHKSYTKKHENKCPTCPVCNKIIYATDDFEYVKTKRQTEIFIHPKCSKKWGS